MNNLTTDLHQGVELRGLPASNDLQATPISKSPRRSLKSLWAHHRPSQTFTSTSAATRDFYALERTFLAYDRTANTLASHGVIIAQLFIIKEDHRHIGMACSIVMTFAAVLVSLFGCYRYFAQSRAMATETIRDKHTPSSVPTHSQSVTSEDRGQAITAGWVIVVLMAVFVFVCTGLLMIISILD